MPFSSKFAYFLNRVRELGPYNICVRIQARFHKKHFGWRWKQKVLSHSACHSWEQIAEKHNLEKNFEDFWGRWKQNDPLTFQEQIWTHKSNSLHQTPTNSHPFPLFFYQEMKPATPSLDFKIFSPDVRAAWETARFGNLFELGMKFENTNALALQFQNSISQWIKQNPFMLGVNWMCPMEVAIRATNWLWGFHFFKKAQSIPLDFWENFFCSLYDHAFYLEHNWETSDKPNNHYIADLIGYFYLCSSFSCIPYFAKAQQPTIKKILEQWSHQIFPDGSAYEGSTAYHKLDTEMFLHFVLLCEAQNFPLPAWCNEKLKSMFAFIDACSINENNFVTIGDDDSGKFVGGIKHAPVSASLRSFDTLRTNGSLLNILRPNNSKQTSNFDFNHAVRPERVEGFPGGEIERNLNHFPNFGLTIIKTPTTHLTLRHPTFSSHQPSGHFHGDQLAITLAYDGIPILVDPGSFVYTANAAWRNYMRSVANHNTFYSQHHLEQEKSSDLFQFPRQPQKDTALVTETENLMVIENGCDTRRRSVKYEKNTGTVTVHDNILEELETEYTWTLVFHPETDVVWSDGVWKISHHKKIICELRTNLKFKNKEGFFAPNYGKIQPCIKLVAQKVISRKHLKTIELSFSPKRIF